MNQPAYDEYEEVESPFASKTSPKTPPRERLRTRKNVFNRPFATDSTHGPTFIETSATRKTIGHGDEAELIQRRSSALFDTEIEYLDEEEVEEEEIIERLPAKRTSVIPRKTSKTKSKNLLVKLGWALIGLLVVRLVFMDRGVWDYFATESVIKDKQNELSAIRNENKDLKAEIFRVQIDKNFQKQLAKEHLGVIAADEFLILFAGESAQSSMQLERSL